MDSVIVYEAADELMANSIRDLLLQNGIGSMVRKVHVSAYGGLLSDPRTFGTWGEVLVYDKDVEKAEELIGGFFGTLGMLEEADLESQALAAEPEEPRH